MMQKGKMHNLAAVFVIKQSLDEKLKRILNAKKKKSATYENFNI